MGLSISHSQSGASLLSVMAAISMFLSALSNAHDLIYVHADFGKWPWLQIPYGCCGRTQIRLTFRKSENLLPQYISVVNAHVQFQIDGRTRREMAKRLIINWYGMVWFLFLIPEGKHVLPPERIQIALHITQIRNSNIQHKITQWGKERGKKQNKNDKHWVRSILYCSKYGQILWIIVSL